MVRKRKCVEWKPVKSRKPSLFNRRVGALMRNEGLTLGAASKKAATRMPPKPPSKRM